ncbi:unnamed protein product [Boreogadus saida]
MRMADQQLSTSEDCVSSPPPPAARVGPLSDVSPFRSSAEKPPIPAQVQPVTLVPLSESRLNGINSSSSCRPAPVIGQTDGKPYPTRIMRLLSNQSRKCPGTGPGQAGDGPPPAPGPGGVSVGGQAWTHLPGLGVIHSFKKLRSSVLQGIQSRGTANQDGGCSSSSHEANGSSVSGRGPGHADGRLKRGESNGFPADQRSSLMGQYGEAEVEEEEDADEEVGDSDGHLRNTRFSRSIRRAYGAGRISILDTGRNGAGGVGTGRPHGDAHTASPGSESDVRLGAEPSEGNADAKALSRSTDNLNLFRRRGPAPASAPAPLDPLGEPPSGTPALQRTGSVSSVGVRGRSAQRWLSPLRTKDHVLRLVGSVTDLTARRRPSASPSPAAPPPSTPSSRIHDDYSRRTPCLPAAERQRRPSPARARSAGPRGGRVAAAAPLEHSLEVHPRPRSESASPVHRQGGTGPASPAGPPELWGSPRVPPESESPSEASGTRPTPGPPWDSPRPPHRDPPDSPGEREAPQCLQIQRSFS